MFWNLMDALNSTQYIICSCFSDVNKWKWFVYIFKKLWKVFNVGIKRKLLTWGLTICSCGCCLHFVKKRKVYQYGYQIKAIELGVKNMLFLDRLRLFLSQGCSQRTPILQDWVFLESSCYLLHKLFRNYIHVKKSLLHFTTFKGRGREIRSTEFEIL